MKTAIVLAQGFADWEYALIAGTGGPFYGLDVRFFAPAPGELRSQGGLAVRVPRGLDELPAWNPRVAAVIGGTVWATPDAPDIAPTLQALHSGGATVAGICGGTLALARAGLLNDAPHTSNDAAFLAKNAPGYSGAAHFRPSSAAVASGRIITAPGTAPASFAAEVFLAAGVAPDAVHQFREMMAAEHR